MGSTGDWQLTMRILIVEDDHDLQRLLKESLTDAGYIVDVAADGEEGHFLGDTKLYDAVVLDLGLLRIDGVTVLERWRRAGRKMLVLILAARDHWTDKVAGFDAGADDYLTKPFYTEELLARLRALLRRATGVASPGIEVGLLRIDTRSSRVTVDGNPVKLTSLEYRLLAYLAHHKGQVISRTDLVEHLYDQDFDRNSNTIEVFIGRLRKKLGVDVIHTIRGLGYRLDGPSAGAVKAPSQSARLLGSHTA
jgi:two-component system OmpR family response regulator